MKSKNLKLLGLLSIAFTTTPAYAEEHVMTTQEASYIEMAAAENQTENLADFLTRAAPYIRETEPGTVLWFALQGPGNRLAIFDVFVDHAARNAHFSGVVAGALKEVSETLVEGGWAEGVVANVDNASVLSATAPVDHYSATTATYIELRAAPGQGNALAKLLTAAGPIVANTEPKTLYWAALRLDEDNFAIFDIFADDSGREAHFAGEVAGLLKEKAPLLVDGGWEEGVVAKVSNYRILAIK